MKLKVTVISAFLINIFVFYQLKAFTGLRIFFTKVRVLSRSSKTCYFSTVLVFCLSNSFIIAIDQLCIPSKSHKSKNSLFENANKYEFLQNVIRQCLILPVLQSGVHESLCLLFQTLLLHGNLISSLEGIKDQVSNTVCTLSLADNEISDLNEVALMRTIITW